MRRYWSKQIEALDPYQPGEQPQDQQFVKLNTNESAYPPTPKVADVIRDFASDDLRRYPDPESRNLVSALATHHNLKPQQVFVGNGSDEVLAHAFQAFFRQDKPILFPDISYSFYPVYCKLYQIEYRQPALDREFRIKPADYATANGGIILANPNAPTGIALDIEAIRRLLTDNPDSVVIIDEAYVDFGAESARQLIEACPNLLVVRTFSKAHGLAGLRVGYALAQAHLIDALQRVKNSFNSYPINRLSSAIAIAAIADETYFEQCRENLIATRETVASALKTLGFTVYPSTANFVFVEHGTIAAVKLYHELKTNGVLVRYFNSPRIDNCLRITIGSEAECDTLISTLRHIIGETDAESR